MAMNSLSVLGGNFATKGELDLAGGLVLINTTAFSAQTSVAIDNLFSATYDNYRIMYDYLPSTSTSVKMLMRASATDITTGYSYNISAQSADNLHSVGNNTTEFALQWTSSATRCFTIIDLLNPFLALNTFLDSVNWRDNQQSITCAGLLNTTSCTGLKISPAAGNITGTIRIYGYKN